MCIYILEWSEYFNDKNRLFSITVRYWFSAVFHWLTDLSQTRAETQTAKTDALDRSQGYQVQLSAFRPQQDLKHASGPKDTDLFSKDVQYEDYSHTNVLICRKKRLE